MANVAWIRDSSGEDNGIIGYKGSKLASLYQNSFSIPYSFVITIQAYHYFLDNRSLIKDINNILKSTTNEIENMLNASEEIQELILNCDLPDSIKQDAIYAYSHMNLDTDILKMLNKNAINFIKAGRDFPYLALRPSFNINGLKAKYILNVKGKDNLLDSIKQIWASMFNPENILIIKEHNIEDIGIAVIAQKMINSDKYALVNVNQNELNINCVYGLGESFNVAVPDSYVVSSSSLEVSSKILNKQDVMYVRDDNYGRTIRKNIPFEKANKEKLSYDELRKISNFSLSVFNIYYKEISVELALENGKIYLIDVNDKPVVKDIVNEQDNLQSIKTENSVEQMVNSNMFSMFNENAQIKSTENLNGQDTQKNMENNTYLTSATEKNKKVPISFDIKITDETNIDELKAKLKAIKEFINQEF